MIETGVVINTNGELLASADDVRREFSVAWNAIVKVRCTRCRRICKKPRHDVLAAVRNKARGVFCSRRCSAMHQRERHLVVVDGVVGRVCKRCEQWRPLKEMRQCTTCSTCWNRRPESRYCEYKRRAKRGFDLTFAQFMTFWQKPCWYCGETPETIGLDRVDNSKGYTLRNVVSCCSSCNLAKLDADRDEFLARCRRIASRHPEVCQ